MLAKPRHLSPISRCDSICTVSALRLSLLSLVAIAGVARLAIQRAALTGIRSDPESERVDNRAIVSAEGGERNVHSPGKTAGKGEADSRGCWRASAPRIRIWQHQRVRSVSPFGRLSQRCPGRLSCGLSLAPASRD